ncbi:MAG: FISUMP domain-containing protein [Flavobacteriales bacterium]
MKQYSLFLFASISLPLFTPAQIVTDIDGNSYNTIAIGEQVWMQENLKTTHFANGDPIETTTVAVNNDSTTIYQWTYGDDSLNIPIYGRLYSWFAVTDSRNVCPVGWHVASDEEWTALAIELGGNDVAGFKMKETGTEHWSMTDTAVTNSSGFTALPGGFRGNPMGFTGLGVKGHFWTSTPWGSDAFPRAYTYLLQSHTGELQQSIAVANCGLSVRCLAGEVSQIPQPTTQNTIFIFPNPASENLTIQFETQMHFPSDIRIFDAAGNLVYSDQLDKNCTTLQLGAISPGIYIVKITGIDYTHEHRLVID